MNYNDIKKVHVVYKTHLDIGFTDTAQNVLDRYKEEHIPRAINLAYELNTEGSKKFIWTVGSFLIDYYLKNASKEEREKMEDAIEKGYIRWHGLACTTHTELMDEALLEYNLGISQKLDKRYGKKTIAAKMTDVPGHTIGLVKGLSKAGIQYLHLGVNPSSKIPNVPNMFVWKSKEDEVIVQYAGQYGAGFFLEGFDQAIEFIHSEDNRGPQSVEEVEREFVRIKKLYPNAKVEASTLDEFAKCLEDVKDKLPIIEEEIGDTWIHGAATDPIKVAKYKELLRLKDKWLREKQLDKGSILYDTFMMNLLLITEHTWGLDYKKYLADFKNWTKEAFQKAREEDITTLESLTLRGAHMKAFLEEDIKHHSNGKFLGSYKLFEYSHEEQRAYLDKAIEALPLELQKEVQHAFNKLIPKMYSQGEQVECSQNIQIAGWDVRINGNGAIYHLEKNNKVWVEEEIGKLEYEIFDANNCMTCYYQYNRDFDTTYAWSESDFSKPGLETVKGLKNKSYPFTVTKLTKDNNKIFISLRGDFEASEQYGSPRKAQIIYTFEEEKIKCVLQWFDKDANKIPEALWFKFNFNVENANRWMMDKLGNTVSPLDVVSGGNRKQHSVEKLHYKGADGSIELKSLHAPLVSIGGKNLYEMNDKVSSLENGFYYNLFNNRWGTNFKMWFEEDCSFIYEMNIKNING